LEENFEKRDADKQKFKCDCCGLCCMNLPDAAVFMEYRHNGSSVCKYFDLSSNLCLIYENRPIVCRVDEAYTLFFKEYISKDEYYKVNYEVCDMLKSGRGSEKRRGG